MTKKTAPEPDGTVDVRPGECIIRAAPSPHGHLHVFVPTGQSRFMEQLAYVLDPGTLYVVSRSLFRDRRSGAAAMLASGAVEIVEDATRGELPSVTDLSDSRTRAILRDGEPPKPGREEKVRGWQAVVVSEGLARCIVEVLDVIGLPASPPSATMENERASTIVRDLVATYDRAFEEGRALQEPWIARARELAALAGYDLAHPERGRIDSTAHLAPEGGE